MTNEWNMAISLKWTTMHLNKPHKESLCQYVCIYLCVCVCVCVCTCVTRYLPLAGKDYSDLHTVYNNHCESVTVRACVGCIGARSDWVILWGCLVGVVVVAAVVVAVCVYVCVHSALRSSLWLDAWLLPASAFLSYVMTFGAHGSEIVRWVTGRAVVPRG